MNSREIVQRTLDFDYPERVAHSFGDSDFISVGCRALERLDGTKFQEVSPGRWERIDAWGNTWGRIDPTSKGEVIQLTHQITVDYAAYNIRVNYICPSTTLTPLIEQLFELEEDPETVKEVIATRHPLGRFAQPEEIAQAVLFLASEKTSFITGAVLPVNDGYTAK